MKAGSKDVCFTNYRSGPGNGRHGLRRFRGPGAKGRRGRLRNHIPPHTAALPQRLEMLFSEIRTLLQRIRPAAMAVEDTFHHHNFKSALTLGQARGVILLAGAQLDIPCYSFAPRKVKQSVVGNGNASKQQVQYMVRAILNLETLPTPWTPLTPWPWAFVTSTS